MVSVSVVAAVVLMLTRRNDELLVRLAGEARTDTLTGLLNRRGFEERASVELAHARREGHAIAVVSFDIDYSRRVNDEWGRETGDRVLARVGAVPERPVEGCRRRSPDRRRGVRCPAAGHRQCRRRWLYPADPTRTRGRRCVRAP